MFKLFDPNSGCFAKYDAFCSHIFDYACLKRKAYSYQKVRNYKKIVCITNIFENGWWEDAYPLSFPSGSTPGHKLQKPPTNLAYRSHLAPLVLFLFTKRKSQKGGHGTMAPLLNKLLRAGFRQGEALGYLITLTRRAK